MSFWDRSIDLVLLAHPESDHITGLIAVLERSRVDAVLFREMALHSGSELEEGANDNSLVTRLTYDQVSLLLPGDVEGVGAIRDERGVWDDRSARFVRSVSLSP